MSGNDLRSCTGGCGNGDCIRCADDDAGQSFGRDCDTRTLSGIARGEIVTMDADEVRRRMAGERPPSTAEVARMMRNGQRVSIPDGCIGSLPLQADDDINAPRYVRPPCPDARYPELWAVLMDAWEQASIGKGAERHGTGEPYTEQPASKIAAMCGPGGPFFQSVKKAIEAERLNDRDGWKRSRTEILGHVVYTMLGVIEGDRRMGK